MKINVALPFDQIENPAEFQNLQAVTEVAQAAERAGFFGGTVTDHPCPTGRWLDAGGHHAPDAFVMLSLVAAATTRLLLHAGVLVLPYRNPFITARAVATLDVFSGGRVTLGLGAGYLKAEFRALGVDFEKRNDTTDEYLRALKAALSGEEFTFKGSGYEALGNRIQPGPLQKPHPPLLVGGNSKRAIRRAAELGDGWCPFFAPSQISSTSRTAEMTNERDLAEGIQYLREHCEKIGRTTPPTIIPGGVGMLIENAGAAETIDKLGELQMLGASGAAVDIAGRSRAQWCDNAETFGAEVLAKLDAS